VESIREWRREEDGKNRMMRRTGGRKGQGNGEDRRMESERTEKR
jgi:hypothetical protein